MIAIKNNKHRYVVNQQLLTGEGGGKKQTNRKS